MGPLALLMGTFMHFLRALLMTRGAGAVGWEGQGLVCGPKEWDW